ncbi:MAG: rod shape-determining protein MreD [Winogradskyella sp.]|nr:rod shape-determining protein MreD [Winogradskyella sp.]MBT8376554.1 rod shape-determining protein MreD [Bacteroidia bacterium]NNC45443.1 rod shape-determining protein MreD [Winogradskyella sp.]NNF85514.1 rod shape-determining protein MreD [Winogradskyella sp.]NNK40559.1 rod shape-determining protein MreD [Winogradskyella sp.]
MNNILSTSVIRFIILVLVQVLICSNINFLGYINPYIYIIFILLFPLKNNRLLLLISSFLIGLTIDVFLDSGGVHAAACVTAAYARPVILKYAFGMLYEHQNIRFGNAELGSLIGYVSIFTIIHHIVLFSLEVFNIFNILVILQKALFSSIFTIILSVLIIIIFSRNSK